MKALDMPAIIVSIQLQYYLQYKHEGIRKHEKHTHEGILYLCDKCDYKAKLNIGLHYHKESEHDGFRYHCHQCDYQAAKPKNKKAHLRTLNEGFRLQCDQC